MTPLALTLTHVIEAGSTVTLVGFTPDTGDLVTIRIDTTPSQPLWPDPASLPDDAVAFEARGLSVRLAFDMSLPIEGEARA